MKNYFLKPMADGRETAMQILICGCVTMSADAVEWSLSFGTM